tara:strand:+ start:4533 stop:5804 length:1272 start_codon:yes stop_codon:yes gene_type:complete
MKLFQRLLVAPAALGLMAPLAANADVTAISKDSDLNSEVIQARVDGVEAQLGEVMAGQFSSSTKMSGKAAFITGYVDDDNDSTQADSMTFEYMYQLNLNTSFTGEDNLYTRIKTGNVSDASGTTGHFTNKTQGTYLSAANSNDNVLKVDKLWYQFPVGDSLTAWVGPKIENYYMLASAPSIYKPVTKQFALGGNGSAYGSSTSPGFGVAWTQQVDDPSDGRWAVSANYTSKDGGLSTENEGLFGDNASNFLLTKIEYGSPRWQVSLATSFKDNIATGKYDGYFHTAAAEAATGNMTAYGLRAYWKPETTGAIPAVQLGYDMADIDNASTNGVDETEGWMVGLGWDDVFIDGNKAGLAFGSRQHATSYNGTGSDVAKDNSVWEAYYTFKVNDGVSITPAVFGGSEVEAANKDITGGVLLTEFRF